MVRQSLQGGPKMKEKEADFYRLITLAVTEKPKYWRVGQAVFNFIDHKYHIAEKIRDEYNVDCYYDDDQSRNFIDLAHKLIFERDSENEIN